MEYNRIVDIILLLAPIVILWVLTLLAYVKMRIRYMIIDYKRLKTKDERIMQFMDMFRLKGFD